MKFKLSQILAVGIVFLIVVVLINKFINTEKTINTNKLNAEAIKPFIEGLPDAVFIEPPAPETLEIVGIHQDNNIAVIYVRHRSKNDNQSLVTTPIEIVRFGNGRWYSKQISQFISE